MEIILAALAAVALYPLIRRWIRRAREKRYLEQVIGRMDAESLQRELESSSAIVLRQLTDPVRSGISTVDAARHLDRAVHCKDRMNRLENKTSGPEFREQYRSELARHLQGLADARKNA